MIGFKELAIIAIIVIIIFGTSKLRNIGGDLGSAIKNFKKAVKDSDEENNPAASVNQAEQKDEKNT